MAERDGDEAVPGYLDWIFAVADPEPGRWGNEGWNPKRMGELSQAAFLARAQALGFGLAVPWGDSEKCDFIVWERPSGRLLRVQVKATGRLNGGGYDVQPVYSTREGKKTYTSRDIDVLAAHVRMEGKGRGRRKEVWYLLPIAAIEGEKNLRFFPGVKGRDPRWEGYREGWEWLRGSGQWSVVSDQWKSTSTSKSTSDATDRSVRSTRAKSRSAVQAFVVPTFRKRRE